MTDLLPPVTGNPGEPPPSPPPPDRPRRMTRRALLGAGLGGAVALAGAGYGIDRLIDGGGGASVTAGGLPAPRSLPANGTAQRFHSRPDLRPTVIGLTVRGTPSPGLMFVGPGRSAPVQSGPMIVDARGELVWFSSLPDHIWATNLQVRRLHGRTVLTWWEGKLIDGYGTGEVVIADTSYREITRMRAHNGHVVDLHEFQLTDEGTALFTCRPRTATVNLTSIGGPSSAHALESIFQEVDVFSGRLIREWRSLDHVHPDESYRHGYAPFDYLHVNSIDVLPSGDLLVSARNTWCVYKLERRTGRIIWRLGGKRSDFAMGPGAQFAWQHDARLVGHGRMTIFDDGFDGITRTHSASRGLILGVDETRRRVTVDKAFIHPAGLLTSGMGNAQLLDNGHMVLGFGDDPYTTEFLPDGTVVCDLIMPTGQHSYRGFRLPWRASPAQPPAVAAGRDRSSAKATLWISWNGATDVHRWRVLGGPRRSDLRPAATVARSGFETAVALGTGGGFAQAVALDREGRALGHSDVVRV